MDSCFSFHVLDEFWLVELSNTVWFLALFKWQLSSEIFYFLVSTFNLSIHLSVGIIAIKNQFLIQPL